MTDVAAAERFRLDVFGRVLAVERTAGEWRLFDVGTEGKRSLVRDVVVPPDLTGREVERFLADMFHEHASARHPDVRRLAD